MATASDPGPARGTFTDLNMIVTGVTEEVARKARLRVAEQLSRIGCSGEEIIDTLEMLGIMPEQAEEVAE